MDGWSALQGEEEGGWAFVQGWQGFVEASSLRSLRMALLSGLLDQDCHSRTVWQIYIFYYAPAALNDGL